MPVRLTIRSRRVLPLCYIEWLEEQAMNLAERIQTDLVEAMRAKDELRLSVLRGIKSAIKLKEVEKIRALDESESIQILQTLVKQRDRKSTRLNSSHGYISYAVF